MSAQHTPGPWRFNEATQTIVSNQSHPVARLTEPFHRQCHGGKTGNDGPLIAAAPDLLIALQCARACVTDQSILRYVDLVIAQATGDEA